MIREAIAKLADREGLTTEEAQAVMEEIMTGEATSSQIGAFLMALRMKGETAGEITGCARAMRAHVTRVTPRSSPLLDTCGTGGDGACTFNVSTAVAFVIAGAGVPVAKHGNRSVSSSCGSADVLEALGVNIQLGPEEIATCIDEAGIGFLFAPRLHPAMKNAAVPRRELGIRTVFNVLGPLTNPAAAEIQLLGVYDGALTEVIAQVLRLLGSRAAMVVHGDGGLDELSITGPNRVTQLHDGEVTTFVLDPMELRLPRCEPVHLKGGLPQENARLIRNLFEGEKGPRRDMVLLNAAAGLFAAAAAPGIAEGLQQAAESIDSGMAMIKLNQLTSLSQSMVKSDHSGTNRS
jgi:anthranilate phosphoribosyltransferase